jgi:hypothetical protein
VGFEIGIVMAIVDTTEDIVTVFRIVKAAFISIKVVSMVEVSLVPALRPVVPSIEAFDLKDKEHRSIAGLRIKVDCS